MSSIDLERDALALVNVVRLGGGLSPLNSLPVAKMGDSHDCVLARALSVDGSNAEVSEHISIPGKLQDIAARLWGASPSGDGDGLVTPRRLVRFYNRFDRGHMPHLVERED